VISVGDIGEFHGRDCDFEAGQRQVETATDADARDPFRWAKIQASRYVESPWRPGESRRQSPSHMMCLSVYPAEGSEEMNVGWCSFPRFVWKPEKDHLPGWSWALKPNSSYPQSARLIRAFLKKYRLKKLPAPRPRTWQHRGIIEPLHRTPGATVGVRRGPYLSHRRGYSPSTVDLRLDDYAGQPICFRFQGTIEEARAVLTGSQFKAELEDIVHGKEHVVPAEQGAWSSFCKTEYASRPDRGGWANFQRAHLSVVAILEHMQHIGFSVEVSDEGGFWETRDLAVLARHVGQEDVLAAEQGEVFQKVIETGNPGSDSSVKPWTVKIGGLAEHLARLRKVLVPQTAVSA